MVPGNAALGNAFPPGMAAASIRRQLRPGTVIKLRRVMDDGEIHEKRFVVVHVDERTVTCIVNSKISAFLRARPVLLRCQVSMPAAAHPFMSHDSHVDCSRTRVYATDDVVRELQSEPGWVLGAITSGLRDEMVAALKFSPVLSAHEVNSLCASLGSMPDH